MIGKVTVYSSRSHDFVRGSPEWCEFRKEKIPSMLAAACLNMDPWRSPRRAWRMIMGLESSVSDWFAENSRRNEEKAVSLYEHVTGLYTDETGIWDRSDIPFIVASPTRQVYTNGIMILYMGKTMYKRLPLYRRIRALTQLLVTSASWCDVVHWHNEQCTIDRVYRSGLDGLKLRLSIFHKRFILSNRCPEKGEIPRWVSKGL